MIPGLLVTLALCVPPQSSGAPKPAVSSEAHKDAVAKFGVAIWNIRRDRLLTAAKQLEAAAKLDPDATAPLRELVRLYSQIGREPDAIRIAKQLLAKDPKDTEIAHALARLLFDAGELKEAVAAAKLAAEAKFPVEKADKAVAVYRDLATVCEKAGDFATAEVALAKAIEWLTEKRQDVIEARAFTPRDADTAAAECLERYGQVLTKRGKYGDAADAFAAAAKLYADPLKANDTASAARLNWNLSGVLQAKGEPAAAIAKLEPFLKLQPVAPEPYARYAKLLRDTDRGADVIPSLQKLADASPKNLPLQVVLAAELVRDQITRSEGDELFKKIMAETNDPKIVEVVVRSHLDHDRPGEVVTLLDRAFSVLKDKDEKTGEKPPLTPERVAAREFAAEKARAVAEILREDAKGATAVLKAAAEGVGRGTKRAHQVYFFLGQLAARHRQLELAAIQFREAIRTPPPRGAQADAYSGLIDVLRLAGKPAELAAACREGLQNAHDLAPHYFNYYLAGALAELGEDKAALAAAEDAIKQTADGDRLTVRLQKLWVLRVLGKWDDAITYGKSLLDDFESQEDRQRIRFALAGAYWGAEKATEAEAELRAILDADPDNAAACNDLGFHLADAGRNLDEAERLIRNAIAADRIDRRKSGDAEPVNAAYLDSLGWVLFRQGKFAEARTELERAAALPGGAQDPVVWDHLGDVFFRLGEKGKAKSAWERATTLYETDARGSARARRDGRLEEVKRKLKRVP